MQSDAALADKQDVFDVTALLEEHFALTMPLGLEVLAEALKFRLSPSLKCLQLGQSLGNESFLTYVMLVDQDGIVEGAHAEDLSLLRIDDVVRQEHCRRPVLLVSEDVTLLQDLRRRALVVLVRIALFLIVCPAGSQGLSLVFLEALD